MSAHSIWRTDTERGPAACQSLASCRRLAPPPPLPIAPAHRFCQRRQGKPALVLAAHDSRVQSAAAGSHQQPADADVTLLRPGTHPAEQHRRHGKPRAEQSQQEQQHQQSDGSRAAAHRSGKAPTKPAPLGIVALAAAAISSSSNGSLAPLPRPLVLASGDSVHDVVATAINGDGFKEESRRYRRTVFSFDEWKRHRSTARYLRHALTAPTSRMVWGLAGPLAWVLLVSVGVVFYHQAAEAGLAPVLWPDTNMASGTAFGLSSFALSLLLVFRTNSSYSRWLDARKAWTTIAARSKDFARQVLTYLADQPQLQAAACRWICAFSLCLMCSLREDHDPRAELSAVLLPHEVDAVLSAHNRPAYALQVLSGVVGAARLPEERKSAINFMDQCLTQLQEHMATCERIFTTPIPLSYTRHTSRFLTAWLTVLPFILWHTYRWTLPPMCLLVAFLLLGIEEIGVSIEEPFSILPLEHLCADIQGSVRELFDTHSAAVQQAQHAWEGPFGAEAGLQAGLHGAEAAAGSTHALPPAAAVVIGQALEMPAVFPGGHGDSEAGSGGEGAEAPGDDGAA